MKICPNCGTAYDDAPVFCSMCGAKLPEASAKPLKFIEEVETAPASGDAAAPLEKKKPAKMKKIILALVCLALVCLLGILLINSFSRGRNYEVKDNILLQKSFNDEVVAFSRSGKLIRQKMEADIKESVLSADGSKLAFLNTDDELWLYANHQFTKQAEKVIQFKLSFDGSSIAYCDTSGGLYLLSGSEADKIADQVDNIYCISPDGKAVAYSRHDAGASKVCYYDGKERELPAESTPAMISNGAGYIYYVSAKGVLFVQKKDRADTRQKLSENLKNLVFNASGTQVLVTESGASYFSENGGERIKAAAQSVHIIIPEGVACSDFILGKASLKGCCFNTLPAGRRNVYYLEDKGQLTLIARDVSAPVLLTGDGKNLYYGKNDALYRLALPAADGTEILLMEGVKNHLFSSDGKSALYVKQDNETYFLKSNGKESLVADEAIDLEKAVASRSGFVYEAAGLLFYTNGGKAVRVSGISADVEKLDGNAFWVVAECDTDEIFVSTDGRRFTKFISK